MANPLDLSKFKKIRTEKDHTVLKHPDGHEIRVLHKPLSPKIKQQLDAVPMSEGGKIGEDQALRSNQRTEGFNKARARGAGIVNKEIHQYAQGGLSNNEKLQAAYQGDKESGRQKHEQHPMKMASGGPVDQDKAQQVQDSYINFEKGKPQSSPTPQTLNDKYNAIREQNKRNMGYADGGVIDPNKAQQVQDSMRKAFHFAEGGQPMATPANEDPTHAMLSEALLNLTQKHAAPQNQVPQEDKSAPVGSSVPQASDSSAVASPEVPPPQTPQGTLPQQAQQNINQQIEAQNVMGSNIKQGMAKQSEIQGQGAADMTDLKSQYENTGNRLHSEFEDTAKDVAQSKIDPARWWHDKSTGSKVLTAIGMLFAGASGGVAGHPEMGVDLINKFINNDIESQKQDINNKNTLLGRYMEMYNSVPMAENAARLSLGASIEGLINQQATKLGSNNAMAAAQMANNKLRQELLPQMEGLARGQVMSQMYGTMGNAQPQSGNAEQGYEDRMQNMRVLNPDLGKDMENKYLPGVGVSRVPVPEKIRDEISMRKDLSDKLAQLENFSRQHSGSLDPKTVKQGKAMAAQVQDAYRTAHQQGVFKESEKNFLQSVLAADPTVFFSKIRAIPGYQEARKFNDQTVKQYYKSYGIKPFSQSGSPESGQMRVKLNSSGQTGTIPANEFDPKLYTQVE